MAGLLQGGGECYGGEMERTHVRIHRSHLRGVDATAAVSAIAFGRHSHDQFGVGLIRLGAQRSASGRGPVEAGPGDVIAVNPGEMHDGAPLGGPRSWQMVYIDPALVWDAAAEAEIASPRQVELRRPVIHDAILAQSFLRAFASVTDEATDPLAREEDLTLLLGALLAQHASMRPPQQRLASVVRARRRIDSDPTTEVSLTELAAEAGVSRFQLLRNFAKETGLPPHAYRLARRVHLARRFILGGMPLAEAAQAAGFGDQSHMNRVFLRHTGATPGAWVAARG